MSEGHFGLAGAYREDPTAANQRAHRERREQEAREDRGAKWIAAKLVGQTYTSFDALLAAAVAVTEAHYGRELTEDEITLLSRATRPMYGGLMEIATIAPTRCIVVREPVWCVTFKAA